MSSTGNDPSGNELVFEYELDAPPEKVWQALCVAEFRRKWLPDDGLADPEPVSSVPGEEIRYRMLDDEPPFLESMVTFQIRPGADDRTLLRIIHRPADLRSERCNGPPLMRAA